MASILLARHGETDWNRRGVWQGQADPPLNAIGRFQARELAARLAGTAFDAIYTSDLSRARETADIVAAAQGLAVIPDPGLREIDVGSWSGLTRDEIRDRFPGAETHDGEPLEVFRARVVGALRTIAERHDGASVLVVTHGGVVRTMQRVVLGEPLPVVDNCETYGLRFEIGSFGTLD
jgi:broad specificity phosphatase PhoE